MLALEAVQTLGERACPQLGSSAQNQPGRLAAGMGVENRDSALDLNGDIPQCLQF